MDTTALFVLIVVFIATFIRSAFGFGEALIAVPLLVLRIPLKIAAPLAVLLSIALPAVLLGRAVNHRLAGDAFLRYVYAGLAVTGTVLLVQAV